MASGRSLHYARQQVCGTPNNDYSPRRRPATAHTTTKAGRLQTVPDRMQTILGGLKFDKKNEMEQWYWPHELASRSDV